MLTDEITLERDELASDELTGEELTSDELTSEDATLLFDDDDGATELGALLEVGTTTPTGTNCHCALCHAS